MPRRAVELAALEKVEAVKIPRALERYWQRLDEIAEAVNAANGAGGWWVRRALAMLIDVWRS